MVLWNRNCQGWMQQRWVWGWGWEQRQGVVRAYGDEVGQYQAKEICTTLHYDLCIAKSGAESGLSFPNGWPRMTEKVNTLTHKWTTFRKGGRLRRWGWQERWEGEAEQWSQLMIDPNESGLLRRCSEGKPQKNARLTSLPILGTWALLYILNAHVPWNAKVELFLKITA